MALAWSTESVTITRMYVHAVMMQRVKDVNGSTSSASAAHDEDDVEISTLSRRTVSVVFISLLLDLVAFTVILPLLPSLLDYYGSHDDEVSYDADG